jgi:ketosteroid isomerase-like protein
MKTNLLFFPLRWLILAGAFLWLGAGPTMAAPTPATAIEAYRTEITRGVLSGNPEAFAAFYAADIRVMPEFQKTVVGRDNVVAYDRAFAARFAVKAYHREVIEVLDLGTRAVETGHFTMEFQRRSGGETRTLVGKYLEIWDTSGAPKLIAAAWNHDVQIDFADELRFPEIPGIIAAFQPRVLVKDRISFDLEAYNRLLESAIIQHDGPLWSQLYADDAVFLANYSPLHAGRAAIDFYIADHVAHLPIFQKLDIRNDRIDVVGRYVIEYASHLASWKNGDSSGVSMGKNIRIWRREGDGSLRIIRQMGMYD